MVDDNPIVMPPEDETPTMAPPLPQAGGPAPASLSPQASSLAPQATAAAQSAPVNVVNPDGDIVSIPQSQMDAALAAGYQTTTPEQVDQYFKEQQYGTPEQQAKTIAEGLAKGVAGPLATYAETNLLGVKPEDIRGREEVNPLEHYGSEIGGLIGTGIAGAGQGALLGRAGEAAVNALGLGGEIGGAAAKIGSAALKGVIEGGLYQSGDEVSKALVNAPGQNVDTAIASVGLGALLGGAGGGLLGSVSPLWHAIEGPKLQQVLESFQKRLGGAEGVAPVADSIDQVIKDSGMQVAPEVKAALKQDPGNQLLFQGLQESTTKSGQALQTALKDFKGDVSNKILESLGKTPESIGSPISEYDTGVKIKDAITQSIKDTVEPLSKKFDEIKAAYSKEPLLPESVSGIAEDLGNLGAKEGYNLSPSSPQSQLLQRTLKELPNLKSLEDLRKYQSVLGDTTYNNPELRRLGGQMKQIFRNAEDDVIQNAAGRIDPAAVDEHALARQGYRQAMTTLDTLNDRLHVGRYSGPTSFLQALKEMAPEDVLRRLNPKNDAGLIVDLAEKFPYAATEIRDYHLNSLLDKAASKAAPGESINSKAFMKSLDTLSPEMRDFLVPADAAQKIGAYQGLLDALPSRLNPSGTARALDHIWSQVPESATAVVSMLFGHNPVMGYVLGHLGKLAARDVPDAVRLAMLKFLGSGSEVQAKSFKASVDFLAQTLKGETALTKGVKDLFQGAGKVAAASMPAAEPTNTKARMKLDDMIKALSANPEQGMQKLTTVGQDVSHYMPEHTTAMANTAATSVQYLNSLRPQLNKAAPFDANIKANPFAQAKYDKALDIAQQPLLVLDKIKRGNITPDDVTALKTMYPGLHAKLTNRLIDQAIQHTDKGQTIPYTTRLGLSMFTGTPMDSTMTPQAILSAQPKPPAPLPNQQAATKGAKSSPALQKMSSMYETPGQARVKRGNKD